jgi:NAD(P)H dehydrogenase (quinone)
VILRLTMFMQNMLGQAASIKTDSKIALPFAKDLPVALIDVRDTGAVGARILIDPAPHAGKAYDLTGKLTTYGAFAEVFSSVLGQNRSAARFSIFRHGERLSSSPFRALPS